MVTDVRFLPDPKNLEEHYPYVTGRHRVVGEFLRNHCEFEPFFRELCGSVSNLMNDLIRNGCRQINLAFGCTAGKHRSVFVAEALAQWLRANHKDITVSVQHRDIPCDLLGEGELLDGARTDSDEQDGAGHLQLESSMSAGQTLYNQPATGPMLQCTYDRDRQRIEFSERNRNMACTTLVHNVLGNGLVNLKSLRERRALSTGRGGEEYSSAHKFRKMLGANDLPLKQPNTV